MKFAHLHLHSAYSIEDGIADIEALVDRAKELHIPAIALTDQNNFYALVKFYRAAIKRGIKPIIGADVLLENPADQNKPYRLVLLCQDQTGYRHLTELISQAFLENQIQDKPQIKLAWLEAKAQGLIAISCANYGDISQALLMDDWKTLRQQLQFWRQYFPNRFYLEVTLVGRPHENECFNRVVRLAEKEGLPLVATNDVRFLEATDFEAHEARVCIQQGTTIADIQREKNYTPEQYLRSPEEMAQLFKNIPQAIENTIEIAKRCNCYLNLEQSFLPQFPLPADTSLAEYFAKEAQTGLEKRLNKLGVNDPKPYQERLNWEIDIIGQMGFAGYFLIVSDFIRWSKDNHIPVGPGRGSGAGSLVAYALEITDLDPLEHDLLFERFLNPERVSLPDFDIDFCMDGRDRVIEYVMDKYGRQNVAQIITFGTMAARAVVRDVGRALGFPYGYVDKIAKLIPFELGMTLEKALEQEPLLKEMYKNEPEVESLLNLALKLEGVPRNVGKHAGGVVIAPSPLTDFTPLYCEAGSQQAVTQFDKDDVEAIGLVKFDFLGLRTLTIIQSAVDIVAAKHKIAIDINRIPLDDEKSYELLKSCQTMAVFQLESRGMRDLIKRLQPDRFDDIKALVALFRPGPLQSGMVDDFINRKHGRAKVLYPHPLLEPILNDTYGVILYQEQVMQIAQALSGYTLGSADLLRKAMGKKKPDEMAKHRAIFVDGAHARGINPKLANDIFDLMEKFAGYGFNKAHSAAYALIAYQTAWLKAHYPAEFMAAVLSSDMDNTDKVVRYLEDCKQLNLKILPPDINRSAEKFYPNDNNEIDYGLAAIKGVGAAAIEAIIEVRKAQGPFQDLFQLCRRVDTRKVNRKVLEALIYAGSLDGFGVHRASLLASVDKALLMSETHAASESMGQTTLFDLFEAEAEETQVEYIQVPTWDEKTKLQHEKEALGWYLSGHPIDRYQKELARYGIAPLANIASPAAKLTVAGYVTAVRITQNKSGKRIAFVTLDDKTGRMDLAVFSEVFEQYRHLLEKDKLIIVQGEVSVDDFSDSFKMRADLIQSIAQLRERHFRCLSLTLERERISQELLANLTDIMQKHRGKCPVEIFYLNGKIKAKLPLDRAWAISPADELLDELSKVLGEKEVELLADA